MTPEGKKLFKRAFIGLGIFFALAIIFNIYSKFTSEQPVDFATQEPVSHMKAPIEVEAASENSENEKIYSAKVNLSNILHSYAYNYYRSNRIRKAIKTWEVAKYVNPENRVIEYRLREARAILNNLVQDNISLGSMDFKYLRYDRAINNWKRAARLVEGIDQEKYKEIQSYISIAEGQLAK